MLKRSFIHVMFIPLFREQKKKKNKEWPQHQLWLLFINIRFFFFGLHIGLTTKERCSFYQFLYPKSFSLKLVSLFYQVLILLWQLFQNQNTCVYKDFQNFFSFLPVIITFSIINILQKNIYFSGSHPGLGLSYSKNMWLWCSCGSLLKG
jgi:hypothetical protein